MPWLLSDTSGNYYSFLYLYTYFRFVVCRNMIQEEKSRGHDSVATTCWREDKPLIQLINPANKSLLLFLYYSISILLWIFIGFSVTSIQCVFITPWLEKWDIEYSSLWFQHSIDYRFNARYSSFLPRLVSNEIKIKWNFNISSPGQTRQKWAKGKKTSLNFHCVRGIVFLSY